MSAPNDLRELRGLIEQAEQHGYQQAIAALRVLAEQLDTKIEDALADGKRLANSGDTTADSQGHFGYGHGLAWARNEIKTIINKADQPELEPPT